jgi:hypothetical protein
MGARSVVIQGSFVGGFPRVSRTQARPPGAAGSPLQARPASQVIPVDATRLRLDGAPGHRLPDSVQRTMETLFGADFSDVRVHTGPQARSVGAIAFTMGSSIYFAPGFYAPATPQGQQLLAHELTHVVQQRAGRVSNPSGAGIAVVQDAALEAEADHMATRAAIVAQRARATGSRP